MEKDKWEDVNQLHYTLEQLQTVYKTNELIKMLQELKKEGYTGLSLGLIIDLIKDRCEGIKA